jgi:hypothetical protein
MARHTFPTTTHWSKTSSYLSVMMFVSAIWILLDVQSPAQGSKLKLPAAKTAVVASIAQHSGTTLGRSTANQLLAQTIEGTSKNLDANKDLRLQNITITQDSTDKSLLTVKGFINNQSDQTHYVYYVVAKFIANDTSIKQTIIPVNIDIQPGKSQAFTHEISTDSVNAISLDTVKPLVIKYEYR